MGKTKTVRFGKVVKKRDELDESKFNLTIKQHGKLSGADSRKLKAAIEDTMQKFITEKYSADIATLQN